MILITVGTTALTCYGKSIFEESSGFISPTAGIIIFHIVQLLMCLLSSFLVDDYGRRPLLIISLSLTAVTLFVNTTYLFVKDCTDIKIEEYDFISFTALLAFIVVFSIGLQTIPFIVLGEIFPTNVKAFAACFLDIIVCVVNAVVLEVFFSTFIEYGMHIPFLIFTICSCIGLVFVIYIVPETKGMSLEEIQYGLCVEERLGYILLK